MDNPKSKGYRDLILWQKSILLVKKAYTVTELFPQSEIYGLTSQMRRAAVSIPSNIAEGQRRSGKKEFKRFLEITDGSCAELETQSIVAMEIGYLSDIDLDDILDKIHEIQRMVFSLKKTLT